MKFNWNSQRGGEIIGKNPFLGRGMDIFWKYTSLVSALGQLSSP